MATFEFIVPAEWGGKKLEAFLRLEHGFSAATIRRAKSIEDGLTMDNRHIRTVDLLRAGAKISVKDTPEQRGYMPSDIEVEAVYSDDDFIIFNKPAGMACHPSKAHQGDTLANVFAARPDSMGLYFRAIGRLDKDTSGAVLCAKHAHAAYKLSGGGRPKKVYLAVVADELPQYSGVIDAPICRETPDGRRRCVRDDGQSAVTHYKTLLNGGGLSLLALFLKTGRTHQIRVHMAHLGCPLAGDALYGGNCEILERHALHCFFIKLIHPISGEEIAVSAALPPDIMEILSKNFSHEQLELALKEAKAFCDIF